MSSFTPPPLSPPRLLLLLPFSIQTGRNTSVLLTVLLHCHCQRNNSCDSHQVRLHCRHQMRHTREIEKLKSYTIIFHIISNQISTTETNYRKNKHDNRNDQCWLSTSTALQKCKRWFCFSPCFCAFFFFFSPSLSHVGLEVRWWIYFWPLSRAESAYSAVAHCRARWQLLAEGGQLIVTGTTQHRQPQHTKGMVCLTSTQTQPDK